VNESRRFFNNKLLQLSGLVLYSPLTEYPCVTPRCSRYAAIVPVILASHTLFQPSLAIPACMMFDTNAVGAFPIHKAAVRRG
jgi:hypothetical protein